MVNVEERAEGKTGGQKTESTPAAAATAPEAASEQKINPNIGGGGGTGRMIAIVLIVALLAVVGVAALLKDGIYESRPLHFWLQAITGNWSPDLRSEVGAFWFSFSAVLALMLSLGTFVALFEIIRRLITLEWRETVRLIDAIKYKDRLTKEEIYNAHSHLSEDELKKLITTIENAFAKASKEWSEKHLAGLAGDTAAKEVLSKLGVSNPKPSVA